MTTFRFRGLETPEGLDAAGRRAWLREASNTELSDALVEMVLRTRERAREIEPELTAQTCLPSGELYASPFGWRASVMGASTGAMAVHHELRIPVPEPADFSADVVVDDLHGVWDRGVLRIGKYQSFRHDDPFLAYNPNHMARWTPHEMLHRALGFFFRRDMSRWELYLSARLNELVPVVHWYGTDSVLRLGRDSFEQSAEAVDRGAPLVDAAWLEASATSLRKRARGVVQLMRDTVEHFEAELAEIDLEIGEGVRIERQRGRLNASSDAVAYVVGHYERLCSEPVAAVIERTVPSSDRYASVVAYRHAVEQLFDTLVFGVVEWDSDVAARAGELRAVQDVMLRAARHRDLDAECFLSGLANAPDGFLMRPMNRMTLLGEALPREARLCVESTGRAGAGAESVQGGRRAVERGPVWSHVVDGLDSVCPASATFAAISEVLSDFVDEERLAASWRREALVDRFATFAQKYEPSAFGELVAFERALARAEGGDAQVEWLSDWPAPHESASRVQVIASEGFELLRFEHDIASWHASVLDDEIPEPPVAREQNLLVGAGEDGIHVLEITVAAALAIESMRERPMPLAEFERLLEDEITRTGRSDQEQALDWIVQIAESGAIGFVRPPR